MRGRSGLRRGPSRLRHLLQISAFARKDALDVLRQPRLLLTLVLGPFLILLAFGLGYKDRTGGFSAWFVASPDSPVTARLEQRADELEEYLSIAGIGADEAEGRDKLRDGEVDVVVVLPRDPLADLQAGGSSTVVVLHDRLDPIERAAVVFAARLAVGEMNTAVVSGAIEAGQDEAGALGQLIEGSSTAGTQLQVALERDDPAAVRSSGEELGRSLGRLDVALRATALLAGQAAPGSPSVGAEVGELDGSLRRLREQQDALDASFAPDGGPGPETRARLSDLQGTLGQLRTQYESILGIDPALLARPFSSDVENVLPGRRNLTDFYAPAAIALLVQQFGVAFGALSFVRERQLGVVELFRAGPMGATQAVVGKYLAYLAVGGLVAVALTALVVRLLDVPVAGGLGWLAVAIGGTLLAAIGFGFVISLVSGSDTQAVQFTLIALLASLFFSGFFLTLDQLTYPAKVISWLLPSTFGISMLRDVMLRGVAPQRWQLAAIAGFAAVTFVLALVGARRRLASER